MPPVPITTARNCAASIRAARQAAATALRTSWTGLRAVGVHGHLGLHLARHIGHAGGHRLGGDVEAGDDRGGPDDRVHRRAWPPDTGLLPGDGDQPALLEPGQRL
jgi:hypothetical protein